ncbi:MAG: hypothetical protein CSA97_00225 [Bacteroidetes bacterium]|nr:MAG: hypothetical protein CSA97_00225 [Bacteroidota bacterium]
MTLSGCALIFRGTKQKVEFNAERPSRVVDVKTGVTICPQTPCTGKVKRSYGGRDVAFVTADGKRSEQRIRSEFTGIGYALLDVLFWPALVVDGATASWMSYPESVRAGRAPVRESKPTPTSTTGMGVYLGIVGFNNELDVKEIELLTPSNQSDFEGKVDNMRMDRSTALYYAIDQAVKRMKATRVPGDLSSVTLVTFTDGNDNISTQFKDASRQTDAAYQSYISKLVKSTVIHGKKLNAYAIGFIGKELESDEDETAKFKRLLGSIGSSRSNVTSVRRMEEVERKFNEIAENLLKISQTQEIKLSVTVPDVNTKVRFVFEGDKPERARYYIEGTVKERRNRDRAQLTGVTFGGMSSNMSPNPVGFFQEEHKTFEFNFGEVKVHDGTLLDRSRTAMYKWTGKKWKKDVEFDPNLSKEIHIKRSSALVMMVLDCSSSLDNDFGPMQEAARRFIEILSTGK